MRSIQNPKEPEQTQGDFLDFIVGKEFAKFLLINSSELLDGLAAQLLWCFHAITLRAHE